MNAISPKHPRQHNRAPLMIALEPRYLFDGAAVASIIDAAHQSVHPPTEPHGPDPLEQALANHVLPVDPTAGVSAPTQVRAADPAQNGGKKAVVFVDTSVIDWQALANGVHSGVEVELIDGGQSGLAQMAKWAQNHTGYDAIHLLSQGGEATLRLGGDTVTDKSLSSPMTQVELAEIGHALNPGGEVLLYGSKIGAGDDGQTLLADLAACTGSVVVAADHAVGDVGHGGTWTLDLATGASTTAPLAISGYRGTLDLGARVTDTAPEPVRVQAADSALAGGKTEVAFIDTSVTGWQGMVADFRASRPGLEIELIDGSQSGLAQMVAWADAHKGQNYDAIHIVSQGAEGALKLGTDTLADGSLDNTVVRVDLRVIGNVLKPGGDMLLYGNDIATGGDGRTFVADLATITGASVIAGRVALAPVAALDVTEWNADLSGVDARAAILAATASGATEVVIVDGTVVDWRTLIAGMDPTIPVIVLEPNSDGFGELNELAIALTQFHNLAAIHLVTEGMGGGFLLFGKEALWSGDLQYAGADLQAIRGALKPGGSLALYGCSVANNDAGKQFINDLAADLGNGIVVEASTDKTGPTRLGGDWDLEYSTGVAATVLPFTLAGMQDISHCLGCHITGTKAYLDEVGEILYTESNRVYITKGVTLHKNGKSYDYLSGSQTEALATVMLSYNECAAPNHAPTLSTTPFSFGSSVNDATTSAAVQVSTLLTNGSYADADGTTNKGIAITGTTNISGTWYYNSSNSTTGGTAITGETTTTPLLLDSGYYVYFVPSSGNTGTAKLNFLGWDKTAGTASTMGTKNYGSAGTTGGTTAYSSSAGEADLTVTSSNAAPTFTGGTTTMSMAHDSGPTSLLVNLHVTDTDSSQTETWTVTSSPSNGTITFTGSASSTTATHASGTNVAPTATDITYTPTAGFSGSDAVTFQVSDGQGGTANRTISFTVTNSAPSLTAGATASYTEKGSSVVVDNTITVTDSDNTTEKSATAVISANFVTGDTLAFSNDNSTMGNIAASWNTQTLTLTSAGSTATKAQWQAALRAVTFSSSSNDPTSAARTVTWTIDDGITTSHASNSPTSTVNVTPVNDPPTLTATISTPTFTEAGSAVSLFSGSAISTVESGQSITQVVLTVSNIKEGATEFITLGTTDVALTDSINGTSSNGIGYTVSVTTGTATLTLTKTDTASNWQGYINALTYKDTGTTTAITPGNRVVTLTSIKDSGGGSDTTSLSSVASTVTVAKINHAPVLGGTVGTTWTEGTNTGVAYSGSSVYLFSGATLTDPDTTTAFNGATLTVALSAYRTGDTIMVPASLGTVSYNSTTHEVSVSGSGIIGTVGGGWQADLVITFNANATNANIATVMNAILYTVYSNDNPTADGRTVTATFNDKANANTSTGALTSTLTGTLTVVATNDAPTLGATTSTPTYTETGTAVSLFSATAASAIEAAQNITQVQLTVSGLVDGTSEILRINGTDVGLTQGTSGNTATNTIAYTVTVANGTATVTLTKTDSGTNWGGLSQRPDL